MGTMSPMSKQKPRKVEKRRQARTERKNSKRKERRRTQAREKHRIMSRQKDIDNLTSDIEAKQKDLQGLQVKVQTYSQEIQEIITATLKKVGVFEKVNKLEEERRVFQQEAQHKANTLQTEIQDLSKMRNWLVGQEQAEKGDKKADLEVVKDDDHDHDHVNKDEDDDDEDVPAKPEL